LAVVACFSGLLIAAACSSKPVAPVPGVDLEGYLILPDSGFEKFYSDGSSQTYAQDTVVEGFAAIDVLWNSGDHEYFRKSDRAWIATLDTAGGGTLFLLQPPLAAIPLSLSIGTSVTAQSSFATQSGPVPVSRLSQLVDTGLTQTVGAGTFDRVVLIRQEFRVEGFITTVDSAHRWFAPGVEEIKRVQWRDGDTDSTMREFIGGTVGGVTYPIPP
jgi:hypothetical protein